jgi:hypothetical protein
MNTIKKFLIIEGRKEDAYNKFIGKTEEGPIKDRLSTAYNTFVENDPSGNHKYLGWMMKQMLAMVLERGHDHPDYHENGIVGLVDKFHKNAQRLSKKDINQYKTVKELDETLENAGLSRREKRLEGADRIFENDHLLVVTPLTREGSCYYGSETRWCTAARSDNQYNNYSSRGTLYYIIWKLVMPEGKRDYQKIARYIDFGKSYEEEGEYFMSNDDSTESARIEHYLFEIRYVYDTDLGVNMKRVPDAMRAVYNSWEAAKIAIDTHYAKNGMNKTPSYDYDDDDWDFTDDEYYDDDY